MGVVLTILKIIGILLLILLGLILFILLSVLFIPICYRAEIEKIPKSMDSVASISWFFGAIRISIGFSWKKGGGRKITKDLRLFGISLVRIRNHFRNRKKRRAEKARQERRLERVRRLEELKTSDPEAYERERQMALTRRREKKAKEEEAAKAAAAAKAAQEAAAAEAVRDETAAQPAPDAGTVGEPAPEETSADDPFAYNAEDFEVLETSRTTEDIENAAEKRPRSLRESLYKLLRMGVKKRAKALGRKLKGGFRNILVQRGPKASAMRAGGSEKKTSGEGAPGFSVSGFRARLRNILDNLDDFAINFLDFLDDLPIRVSTFLLGLPRKIWNTLSKIFGKLSTTIIVVRKVVNFVQDYRTRAFVRQALRTLRKFLRHVFPRRIDGFLHYGFSDPSWTGISLGAWGILVPQVRGDFHPEPEFDQTVFEGDVDIRGRIFLFYLLFLGLRLYLNKNTKFVIRFMQGKGEEEEKPRKKRRKEKSEEAYEEVA